MRVLVFSDGPWPDGDHRVAWTFSELISTGDVEAFKMVSMGKDSNLRSQFLKSIPALLRDFRPDVLIWHMDDASDLTEGLLAEVSASTRLVYHDLDAWVPIMKPVAPNQRLLAKYAEKIFLTGLGEIKREFKPYESKVRLTRAGFCDLDLPKERPVREQRLLFIGSSIRRFKPILGPLSPELHPGRRRAVRYLQQRLRERFTPYGSGYPAAWGIAPCDFETQFELMSRSLAIFTIDAAPRSAYFTSNRTAFALACGCIVIKPQRPLDDYFYRGCPNLFSVADAEGAADVFELLCCSQPAELERMAEDTRAYAQENLRLPNIYRKMLDQIANS